MPTFSFSLNGKIDSDQGLVAQRTRRENIIVRKRKWRKRLIVPGVTARNGYIKGGKRIVDEANKIIGKDFFFYSICRRELPFLDAPLPQRRLACPSIRPSVGHACIKNTEKSRFSITLAQSIAINSNNA